MRLSQYFLPVLREAPADATIVSHKLMLRAGLVRQTSAGIYSWLPLGLRLLKKIEAIVREEQNKAGAIELLMPTIQPASLWQTSGRYDDYGEEMLRIQDRSGREMLYGPTNEEMITELFAKESKSWRDCGKTLYHIQWKFRDEMRPRFGVLRGREFLMKDGYSFDLDKTEATKSYQKMFMCYLKTFERLGVKAIPVRANAGPIGGNLSHEFIVLADTGESEVYCHKDLVEKPLPKQIDYESDLSGLVEEWTSYYAAEGEKHDKSEFAKVPAAAQLSTRGIEVGHIFYFGDKYSKSFDAAYSDKEGKRALMHCGSYGIGISRLAGAVIEASHDDKGIIFSPQVAPFDLGLLNLSLKDTACTEACNGLYEQLGKAGFDVLYDDRDESGGSKFATMDLIGLPFQIVVGSRGIKQGTIEVRARATNKMAELPQDNLLNYLKEQLGAA